MAETIPAFDFRRWGVGGIVAVGTLLILGIAAFLRGFSSGSIPAQVLGTICLGAGITIFFVKVSEEIKVVSVNWSIVGETGEVVDEVSPKKAGVVRVRSELWSATSEAPIPTGAKVRVVRQEGLQAWVAKLEGRESQA